MSSTDEEIRLLIESDAFAIERLLHTSEYVYQRFTTEELPLILKHYPAAGLFHGNSLQGFLFSQTVYPPSAWIAGFGVNWMKSSSYVAVLKSLLEFLSYHLYHSKVRHLHYSGNDSARDWLRPILLSQGFTPYCQLYSYDKYEFRIPTNGNQEVLVRPVNLSHDLRALQAIEQACFEDLWRYDNKAFRDIATTHPYFVVAEQYGKVVGYQFNTVEVDFGYLIRIAVHPGSEHQGIGARLMAEAIRFFERERVSRIMLNTQDNNIHAHRLYEWFGFLRLQQKGFVLRKYL